MHVIRVRYGNDGPRQVKDAVRYISHREEHLPGGDTRRIHGIGPRYRELRGDERAIIDRLVRDAEGLKTPVYYRVRLTVNDPLAARMAELGRRHSLAVERVLRDAVEKTLRGVARSFQGVHVVHAHGGRGRQSGHPHVHAYLSPRRSDGSAVRPRGRGWLRELRHRWGQEVERATERYERRLERAPVRSLSLPERSFGRSPGRTVHDRTRAVGLQSTRSALPWLALGASVAQGRNSERMAQRLTWRVASLALPPPLRAAARVLGRLLPGER